MIALLDLKSLNNSVTHFGLLLLFAWLNAIVTPALAQKSTVEFLPSNISQEFELVKFVILPATNSLEEDEKTHQIQYVFHAKSLSGEWIFSKQEMEELTEEENFVKSIIDTYRNIQNFDEFRFILDESSFGRRLEVYSKNPDEFDIDRSKYDSWSDVRPFSLVRYGNVYLVLCDVKMEESDDNFQLEVFELVLEDSKYRLTDFLDLNSSYDVISNSFFQPGIGDGRLLSALRERAGIE